MCFAALQLCSVVATLLGSGVLGSELGLVDPASVYGDWMDSKFDLQLLSQCCSAFAGQNGLSPDIDFACCGDVNAIYTNLPQIISIAFKGSNRFFFFFFFFFTISSLRREPSPTSMLKWFGRNRATNRALITCNMFCYVPRGTKGQLSY